MAGLNRLAEVERRILAQKASHRRMTRQTPEDHRQKRPSFDGNKFEEGERIMWFIQKFIVRKHERGLLFKDGDFIKFLAPGIYRFYDWKRRFAVERFDLSIAEFKHRLIDYLAEAERTEVDRLFHVVETNADEVALVYLNDRVATVLGPAERQLYWKGVIKVRVESYDLNEGITLGTRLTKHLVIGNNARVLAVADAAVYARIVPDGHVGLLYVDGELTETLEAGLHAYWNVAHAVGVELVDLRIKALEVQGQEILT